MIQMMLCRIECRICQYFIFIVIGAQVPMDRVGVHAVSIYLSDGIKKKRPGFSRSACINCFTICIVYPGYGTGIFLHICVSHFWRVEME